MRGHKSQVDLSRKKGTEKLTTEKSEVSRKGSPAAASKLGYAGRKTVSFDSPLARYTVPRPQTRQSEDKSIGLPRKTSYTDIFTDPSNRSISPKVRDGCDPVLAINKTLTDRLRALGPHYDVRDRYLIFQDTFATVISLDASFSLILRRIKNGYEEVVAQYLRTDYDKELTLASKQVLEMQQLIESQHTEKEELVNLIEMLQKDSEKLKIKGKEQFERIKYLESELKDALETVRKDAHSDVSELQAEITHLKAREKAMLSILRSAKQDHLSVDDLLMVLTRHRKTQSTYVPATRTVPVPRLNLPISSSHPFGLLSPIHKEEDRSDHDAKESLASFCKDFEALPNSRF